MTYVTKAVKELNEWQIYGHEIFPDEAQITITVLRLNSF